MGKYVQSKLTNDSAKNRQERGTALTELTLILPVLTFLILAVTDFGMFLQSYFQVCHIAREGLRTAVATPDLSGAAPNYGKYVATTDTAGVIAFAPAGGISNEHRFIHDRTLLLLKASNGASTTHSLQLANNAVEIWTRCIPNGGTAGADKVEVEVQAQYKPITPFNDLLAVFSYNPLTFNFKTKSQGAYLFNDCAP